MVGFRKSFIGLMKLLHISKVNDCTDATRLILKFVFGFIELVEGLEGRIVSKISTYC